MSNWLLYARAIGQKAMVGVSLTGTVYHRYKGLGWGECQSNCLLAQLLISVWRAVVVAMGWDYGVQGVNLELLLLLLK